ncbi:cytochrome P450, partial [Streptomyces olivochromogenes]|uniref:cytochrome P450 n=1 Tax=Streptomyces olivochromogenes TaxID=1963 RepID=UPI001F1DAACE
MLDLADPTTFAEHDMPAFWRRLRREDPVHWQPPADGRPGFWVVSRHRDVEALYRDTEGFAAAHDTGPAAHEGMSLAVTPRALRRIRPCVEEHVRALVRRAVAAGVCDFATEVAERIPSHTVCALLDVPAADRPFLLDATKRSLVARGEITEITEVTEVTEYFAELARARRAHPGEDAVSALVAGQVRGRALSDEDIALTCAGLLLDDDGSARLTLTALARALAEHPSQWRALRGGEIELTTATEEVLRWATPDLYTARRATRDTTLHGRHVRAGDLVALWLSSANRDEEVFADPDVLDLRRTPNPHLSLGAGSRLRAGGLLGRAEIGAVLAALRDHAPDISLAGPGQRVRSTVLQGHSSLPVSFAPTSAPRLPATADRRVKLFLVPFAGGSARAFQPLLDELGPEIDAVPIEPPGRDGRHHEEPYGTFTEAVEDIAGLVADRAGDGPYAVYGYSLGGLFGYEAVRRLVARGHRPPRHLFVSASRPPQRPYGRDGRAAIHAYPDLAFLGALAATGGVPEEFLEHADAVSFFTTRIRQDYELYAQYRHTGSHPRLSCPLTVVTGAEDPVTSQGDLDLWADVTDGPVTHLDLADAGHFFLDSHAKTLAARIHAVLLDDPAAGAPHAPMTPELFREAMAHLAAPVTVVTTRDADGRPRAFTASAVCSLSADPPLLLVCVNRAGSAYDVFASADRFLVNVLGDEQAEVARAFARHDRAAAEATLVPLELGLPGLPGAAARFACTRRQVLPGGDHSILTGRLETVALSDT